MILPSDYSIHSQDKQNTNDDDKYLMRIVHYVAVV